MCRLLTHPVAARTTALVVLGAYLVAAFGLLPSPAQLARWISAPIAEPFPCQDHACGCASAIDCWTQCCCFTDAERLAWARERGIEPPAEVVLFIAESDDTSIEPHCPLCIPDEPPASCCSTPSSTCGSDACEPSTPFRGRALSPLGCKNVEVWLVAVPPPAVGSIGLSLILPEPGLIEPLPAVDRALSTRALDVPSPPPRA